MIGFTYLCLSPLLPSKFLSKQCFPNRGPFSGKESWEQWNTHEIHNRTHSLRHYSPIYNGSASSTAVASCGMEWPFGDTILHYVIGIQLPGWEPPNCNLTRIHVEAQAQVEEPTCSNMTQ